jgi:5-methylcytosine-specific restriction endonuclease McrA
VRDPRPGLSWSRRRILRRVAYGCWMESDAWKDLRRRWYREWIRRNRCTPACAICGKPWNLATGDLHHRSYRHLGSEPIDDLIACHRSCHDAIHAVLDANPA